MKQSASGEWVLRLEIVVLLAEHKNGKSSSVGWAVQDVQDVRDVHHSLSPYWSCSAYERQLILRETKSGDGESVGVYKHQLMYTHIWMYKHNIWEGHSSVTCNPIWSHPVTVSLTLPPPAPPSPPLSIINEYLRVKYEENWPTAGCTGQDTQPLKLN